MNRTFRTVNLFLIMAGALAVQGVSLAKAGEPSLLERWQAAVPVMLGGSASTAPQQSSVLGGWIKAVQTRLDQINPAAPPVAAEIGSGPTLKLGMTGGRVDRLAASLTAHGWLKPGLYHGVFDATLAEAVAAFQTSEGLVADGRAGETTVEALDRTPAAAAAALRSALAEMRALAADAPSEYFLVNIPSQTAYLIRDDQILMSMRVVVGRPTRPTPLLEDRITEVIINPTWTAPPTVLAEDKLPSLRKTGTPGIADATIWLDGQVVDPATVDWKTVTPERLRIVQSPGNQNALGLYKFNLTNSESIYLHDTNDRSLFARQARALSSGCVRLGHPRALAESLLGREGWLPERIARAVESHRTQGIALAEPLPVRIVYWLATVEGGSVQIHKDIYDHALQPQAVLSGANHQG